MALDRRELLGALLALLTVGAGRLLRQRLLLDAGGAWRDPLWLDSLLPPLPEPPPPPAPKGPPAGPLDINACHPDSLLLLPGVGPVLAGRIAAARAERPFAGPEDLERVKGIGPRTRAKLAPLLLFPAARDSSR